MKPPGAYGALSYAVSPRHMPKLASHTHSVSPLSWASWVSIQPPTGCDRYPPSTNNGRPQADKRSSWDQDDFAASYPLAWRWPGGPLLPSTKINPDHLS